jgi:hypothetical protein
MRPFFRAFRVFSGRIWKTSATNNTKHTEKAHAPSLSRFGLSARSMTVAFLPKKHEHTKKAGVEARFFAMEEQTWPFNAGLYSNSLTYSSWNRWELL